MRTGAHFRKPNLVALHEQLNAENPAPAERRRHLARNVARAFQRHLAHRLRLPAFHIIAFHLHMPDGRTEGRFDFPVAPQRPHGEQRDLIVKNNPPLDDHQLPLNAPARHRIVPCGLHIFGAFEIGLPLARRRHDRLDETRKTNLRRPRCQLFGTRRKSIRRRRQSQFFRRQRADTFAVHRQLRGPRGGDHHGQTFRLDLRQLIRRNRFDLRHDQMRPLKLDHRAQSRRIRHLNHMRAMRHLMRGRVGITIHRNHLRAIALQLNRHFFAQLARPEQHDACGIGSERCADTHEILLKIDPAM